MHDNQFFRDGFRGCSISLVSILLAICAMVLSTNYHYLESPACGKMLGAGFPSIVVCDTFTGSSPLGELGQIDYVDVFYGGGIRPEGFLLDFLFYLIPILIIWFIVSSIFHKGVSDSALWWTTFIVSGFIAGFLFAFLIIYSSQSYDKNFTYLNTPVSIIPSPTPLGTIPALITPRATPGP